MGVKRPLWKDLAVYGALVLVVLAVLYILSWDNAPGIPSDDLHAVVEEEIACLRCHSPSAEAPLGRKHPPKERCLLCHKRLS